MRGEPTSDFSRRRAGMERAGSEREGDGRERRVFSGSSAQLLARRLLFFVSLHSLNNL